MGSIPVGATNNAVSHIEAAFFALLGEQQVKFE